MTVFILLYAVNFVRTLFVIALIYFGVRFITRYLFPMMINKGMQNMQQKMQDQQRRNQPPRRPEGEVTLEGQPQHKKNGQNSGEYVDFEEVD